MENCIFCKIGKKVVPADIVYEDDQFIAFLDIQPVKKGHVLIVPKEHYESLTATPDEIVKNIFVTAKTLMPGVKKAVDAEFVVLTIVGTDVPHFHIHLIPRSKDDGLAGFWPAGKYDSSEEKQRTAEKIRNAL